MATKSDILRTIWFFMSRYKKEFFFLIVLAALAGLLETLNVTIMYPILSNGLGTQSTNNPFLVFIDQFVSYIPINDTLVRYCVLFIVLACLVFLTKVIYFYWSTKITTKIVIDTKQNLFNKCVSSDYQFFIDHKQGEILYKITTAPTFIAQLLNILSYVLVEIILLVSVFSLLLSMSWKATILIIIGGIAYYYLTKYLSIKIHYVAGKKQVASGQKENVVINELTTGIKQIKVFETFSYWKNLYEDAIHTYWTQERKSVFWNRVPEILIVMMLYLSIGATVIFIKITQPSSFVSTIPVIGTFAFAVFLILPKVSRFGNYRMQFMQVLPNVETVHAMLKETAYESIRNGEKEFKELSSGIELKNVTFAYKGRDDILRNANLKIQKDKITALVGPSGSGKSTVVNLLLRLHDIENGGVYIDGVNIKEFDIFSYLKKVGYVSQETFIFNGSVQENIAFGTDYMDRQIADAARLANADEFIGQLPEKYDTLVGDHGMRLSGGEKQRLAIARAMIRIPEILLLDEATSSLDNVSESIVQKAINTVSKNCTTFIIAHRLSTIQHADVIYVMDHGEIVESGTHEQLLNKKGKYWDLYNIQKNNV